MISLQNISKSYGNQKVLHDFSTVIRDGDFTAITGPSGRGKTTLLNIMGLLEQPNSGEVVIDGQKVFSPKKKLLFYRHMAGFLFQNYALIEDATIESNLKIALSYQKMPDKTVAEALDMVGLRGLEKKKVFQLSGGEQQRIALARVLIKDPKYIFADEPTGNLDRENRDIVFGALRTLHEQGKTIILVTHDMELAGKAQRQLSL